MVTNIERIVEETFRKARQESLSQGMAQGLAQGLTQGLTQGLAQGKQESALAALREGLNPQLVSKITGLPLDKVL
ncbi:MAG: transposase, partial [Bacillota bacterium]